MLATTAEAQVIVAALAEAPADRAEAVAARGAEVLPLPAGPGGVDLSALLDNLGARQWTNLFVEGGAEVLHSIISQGLADELLVFIAPRQIGPGAGPAWEGLASVAEAIRLPEPVVEQVGQDVLKRYVLHGGAQSEQTNQ